MRKKKKNEGEIENKRAVGGRERGQELEIFSMSWYWYAIESNIITRERFTAKLEGKEKKHVFYSEYI